MFYGFLIDSYSLPMVIEHFLSHFMFTVHVLLLLFLIPFVLYVATYKWPSQDGKTFILHFKIRARWDKGFIIVQCYSFSPFCVVLVQS